MKTITSVSNPTIKDLVQLGKSRKFRMETGLFVVEGATLAKEASESGYGIHSVFFTERANDLYTDALEAVSSNAKETYLITDGIAEKASALSSPQGIFTVLEMGKEKSIDDFINKKRIAILDGIQDPGNLGAIARSALAFGFDGLILSFDTADWLSQKAQRAAMGALLRSDVAVLEAKPSIERLRQDGFLVSAAALTENAVRIDQLEAREKMAIVIGNESAGLSEQIISACDIPVIIPIDQRMESLNAAAAAAVLMYCLRG